MAKKRKTKAQENHISREKYIKTQARNLPIYECLINENWNETKICSILITRQHKNGNFTSGFFLVDLFCLGVKDAECTFNESPIKYDEFKNDFFPDDFFEKIDYALAHNIILASVEFAEDYGFKPCKEYTQYIQYILEEDSDDIELIEIECGRQDKPFIIADSDNQKEYEHAYNHLKNTVGVENFFYEDVRKFGDDLHLEDDYEPDFDDEEYDEEPDITDYIYSNPSKERDEDIKRFNEIVEISKPQNNDDINELIYVTKRLFYNYYGLDIIESNRDNYLSFLNVALDESMSEQFTGTSDNELNDMIENVIDDIDDVKKLKKYKLKTLAKKHPEIPLFCVLHLAELSLDKKKKYIKYLKEYASIYPDYVLIQLINDQYELVKSNNVKILTDDLIKDTTLKELFGGRDIIHPFEYNIFQSTMFSFLSNQKNSIGMDAFLYSSNTLYMEMSDPKKEFISDLSKVHFCQELYLQAERL